MTNLLEEVVRYPLSDFNAHNNFKVYTHDHKWIVYIYILETGPSEVAVYCDRNTYVLKQLTIPVARCLWKLSHLYSKCFDPVPSYDTHIKNTNIESHIEVVKRLFK